MRRDEDRTVGSGGEDKKSEEAAAKEKNEEGKDIYLSETLNVLCDLIEIAEKNEQSKQD